MIGIQDFQEAHKGSAVHQKPNDKATVRTGVEPRQTATIRISPSGEESLFLAPAATENVRVTLESTVAFEYARQFLSTPQFDQLKVALDGKEGFHCWAMTRNSRSRFAAMRRGDHVLMSEKGTGIFGFHGTILTKFESTSFGSSVWPSATELPWELVYVLDPLRRVNIEKFTLVAALGYSPNDPVPGIRRVNPAKLRSAIGPHGTLSAFINALERDKHTT